MNKPNKPTIICLTPVKNEAWILKRFLQCASLWADHIIITDQNSDDGSIEIASSFEKVILVPNKSPVFNEQENRGVLINEARKFPQPRLLIALDADEFLTSNFHNSCEWQTILNAVPGSVIAFPLANIVPGMRHCWIPYCDFKIGYMDNGNDYVGKTLHGSRLPYPDLTASYIMLNDIKIMHYQFTDWQRMKSKHRWYQCFERISDPTRSAIEIYRQYHHMDVISKDDMHDIPMTWFEEYERCGIEMTSVLAAQFYRWDKEVLDYFKKYGVDFFRRENIWDVDWFQRSLQYGYDDNDSTKKMFHDPRTVFNKIVHKWLRRTQKNKRSLLVRIIDRIIATLEP